MNVTCLIGRLTRDPELKQTQTGKSVVNFTLAVDKRFGEGANFINIVAWEKTAEFVDKYMTKGRQVGLRGEIQTRDYEGKHGKVYVTEVVADSVYFADSKPEGKLTESKTQEVVDDIDDDDVPF